MSKAAITGETSTGGSKRQHQRQQQHKQQSEAEERPTKTETETRNEPPHQRQSSWTQKKMPGTSCSSPRRHEKEQRHRHRRHRSPNKIYRTPPTPEPEVLRVRERSFILDSIAVNTTSNDCAKARPKLGQVRPRRMGLLRSNTLTVFLVRGGSIIPSHHLTSLLSSPLSSRSFLCPSFIIRSLCGF